MTSFLILPLVEQQNLCYLKQSIHTQNIYTTINRKLKSQTLQTLRNYYSYYKEFSEQDYEDIIKLCKNNIGNKYLMPNKKLKVFVKKGKIFFISVL